MDKEVKIDVNLINTCHACLSSDRVISALGENADMLVSLLGSHGQCLVYGIEDIKVCWECRTMLRKFKSFQGQVRMAQAGLMVMLYEDDSNVRPLSKLSIIYKSDYDQDIKHHVQRKPKKTKQLESITVVKTEFDDIRSYSDEDDALFTLPDSKINENDNKSNEIDNKLNRLDNKTDNYDDSKIFIDNKDSIAKEELDVEYVYDVKDEAIKSELAVKVKKPRRKRDIQCVNNVVGYYKRYARLVKTEKKDWGSWEDVRAHFKSVQFSEKEMEEHFFTKDRRNISYEKLPHKCDICTLGFTREDDLKRHNDLNHHKEGTSYKCGLCSKRQASAAALEQHWRSHSVVFQCRSCDDVCKENFMRKHLDHAHTKTYDCTVCHRKFGTLKSFTIHYKEMHMTYVCDHCGHTLTTRRKMEKHISEHHVTYTCKDCNRQYKNYIYYKKHCYSLHPDKVNGKNDPELSFCVECNKQFPSVDKYKTHLRVSLRHNKKKAVALPCPECGKMFCRKKNLMYHYNLFHLKKTKYYCEICDKYFARPSGLRTHRQNVHLKIEKVKDKICDLCGRAFSSHVVLRHHRRTHTGERPHKCPHCSAEFIQKYAMQTHVRTQHKEFLKDTPAKDTKKASVVPAWPEAGYFV